MRKELIISTIPQETRVAILEDDELVEFIIERHRAQGIAGNIYKGRVTKVLPGMQSAFVDIGLDRDGFLYVSDFFEDVDEYERIVTTAEDEAFKDSPSSGPSSQRRAARVDRAKPKTRDRTKERERPKETEAEPAESEPPKPESGSRPRTPERRGPRRRPEQRDRKARIPSFEPRSEDPSQPALDLLPGESLAKYRDQPKIKEPAVVDQSGVIPDPDAPLDVEKDDEVKVEESGESPETTNGVSAERPEFSVEGSSDSPPDVSEDPVESISAEPAPGNTVSEEGSDSETSADGEESAETNRVETDVENGDEENDSASVRRGRISERRDQQRFSRKPPARRPRRRSSPRSGSTRSDTSSKAPTISDLLREGQEILVQVSKEPLGRKGARITSHIALPGRYLVYMPTVDHIGVSRKIESEEERARLRTIIAENREELPGGFIVRTAAEGRDEKEFVQDLRFLAGLWGEICERNEKNSAPALIHSDLNLVQRVLRDQLSDEFKAIRLDSEVEYTKVLEFVSRFQPSMVNRVRLHLRDNSIFEEHGLQEEIDKAMRPKVWLKSGGYIVVNQTEALVAIDVNTGKFVGKSNRLEDTIVRTNMDAVHEIVRQIRLRNLGGIIVVDFIDMEERKSRQRVMQALEQELQKDRSPSKVLQFNDFGLVAITRKRTHPSLERVMGTTCPRCAGAGFVKAVETVCYEIQQEVKKMLAHVEGDELTIRVNPDVAKGLKSGEFVDFTELEEETKKDIRIQGDPTLVAERFDIY